MVAGLATLELVGIVADIVASALYLAAGIALLFVRPRRGVTVALALFLLSYGGFFILVSASPFFEGDTAVSLLLLAIPGMLTTAVALLWLAWRFPRPMAGAGARAILAVPVAFATLHGVVFLVLTPLLEPDPEAPVGGGLGLLLDSVSNLSYAIALFFFFLMPLRARALAHAGDEPAARAAGTVGGALGLYVMVSAMDATFLYEGLAPAPVLFLLNQALTGVVLVGLWCFATTGVPPGMARRARNIVLVLVGTALAALLPIAVAPAGYRLAFALARFAGFAVLAYGVVRQQLFDLDIRIKLALPKGLIAAAIVAVFFAVSEAAQAFFSERAGTGVGIAASALLVFAIAPLNRLAERFTDRAMPNVRPQDPAYVLGKKRETYRNAYAAAWADGHLSAKDARLLAEFKEALGLPDAEYAAIERDWARSPKA